MKKPVVNPVTKAMQAKAQREALLRAGGKPKTENQVNQEPPKIEFPCDYPIRVMGDAEENFVDRVFAIMQSHAPEIERDNVKLRPSSKGTFVSVHIVIRATGEDQLIDIHASLKAYSAVKMVI